MDASEVFPASVGLKQCCVMCIYRGVNGHEMKSLRSLV